MGLNEPVVSLIPPRAERSLRSVVRVFGPAGQVVRIEPFEPVEPGPREVRLRMLASAINPSDLVTISGQYAHRTPLPFIPGFEGVGVVESVGPGVDRGLVGSRMLAIGTAGAWQDFRLAESGNCFRVADALSDDEAATGYINPLTALLMLHGRAKITSQTRLVLNAAASAIGRILIRMANQAGIRPIAVVRHERSRALLDGTDLEAVIVSSQEDLTARLASQDPIDLALDAVGGDEGTCLASSVRPGGHFLHYGLLSGLPLPADLSKIRPDLTIEYFWLRSWVHESSRDIIASRLDHVSNLIREGIAGSLIEARYPLSSIQQAIQHTVQPGRLGKILIRW